jgi:hypothetical protein
MEYFNIWNNLIRISIYATQFTSNWLTDNRIIGIHCPLTFFAGVNFVTHCGLGKSADKMKSVAEFPNDGLILTKMLYTVKKLSDIPAASRDVTYQSLPRRE